jgi:uncharacterized membrane protein YphA (DoxX/SURF4 family)
MNRVRDRIGLNVPPLLLRMMLGGIFLWAGLGKVCTTMEVQGEQAAILANMGVIEAPGAAAQPAPPVAPPAPAGTGASFDRPGNADDIGGRVVAVRQTTGPRVYSAADFPKPVAVKPVYMLALGIHAAANPPAPEAGGPALQPIWPPAIGGGKWPVYLAWAVVVTELGGGLCVLLGLFTRMWSLGLAGVMLGAMWLTQIGPAVQTGKTTLGFLPARPAFDPEWTHLLFEFCLFMAALALALLGPGRASLDHVLLGGRHEEDDEE